MSILTKLFGDPNEKELKKLWPIVAKINEFESEFNGFDDEQLKQKSIEFKKRLADGEVLDGILPEAFACAREVSWRVLGNKKIRFWFAEEDGLLKERVVEFSDVEIFEKNLREKEISYKKEKYMAHFDVQLIGGIALHQGKIAEMKTGEGKTLVATLPLYLNALSGKGSHLVTVNDYLSRVGAGWMAPVYFALGLSTGVIVHESAFIYDPDFSDESQYDARLKHFRPVSRKEAYAADITYGTNNEFGFDYLRDNMAQNIKEVSQRGFNYAIVDEIDSILIDEARTPLIISAPDMESGDLYQKFSLLVPKLQKEKDFIVEEKFKNVTLTDDGIEHVEKILGMDIYNEGGVRFVHHLQQALKARVFFTRDKDYVVKNGEVIIVDEFTGRLMPGRRYSEGLHQAIEAQEGVKVQRESRTLATITFQNYFRMYEKLSGMTGTAATSAEEFSKVYNLEVLVVPTNNPMIREDRSDKIYQTEKGKFMAVAKEIKQRHAAGQPVLVGTVSIEKNEFLGALLKKEGIPHELLNAKNHEREAQIIARAGRKGAVTVATNMAGRGVDIILGGRPEESENYEEWLKAHNEVVELGGLCVFGTERHEARRIDNQLRGRSGRQGDPGLSQFFVSFEDDLMRIFAPDRIKNMMAALKIPEDEPIEQKMVSRAIESAQEKIEGFHFDARKHVLEYDEVLNKQRTVIYKKRREILEKEDVKDIILEMCRNEIGRIVDFNEGLKRIFEIIKSALGEKSDEILNKLLENRDLENDREKLKDDLYNIAVKIHEEKEKEFGEDMRAVEKFVLLRVMDGLWMDHLDEMGYLRESVRLRAYGQKDPLVEYKREGREYFDRLLGSIEGSVFGAIFKVSKAPAEDKTIKRQVSSDKSVNSGEVGRNDLCPCGSGKKYKKCCGQ